LSPENSDEVLLKQRLDPKFDSNGNLVFVGSGKKTVDVQQIKGRFNSLKVIVDWKRFDELVEIRNKLEHYFATEPRSVVDKAISEALAVLRTFVSTELGLEPRSLFGETVWDRLLKIDSIYNEHLAECKAEIQKIKWPHLIFTDIANEFKCIRCNSSLVKPTNPDELDRTELIFSCTSCGEKIEYEQIVTSAISDTFEIEDHRTIANGGDLLIDNCHECGQRSFHYEVGFCLLCDAELSYATCSACSEPLSTDDQDNDGLCSYHYYLFNKDD
jgi:DNA-directed RNA polymerase subunit RPC12/RpoP